MQPFCNAIMTDEGARLFMRAQAGDIKMQFTRIAVGDGSYSEDERKISNLQGMAELKSQRNEYLVSNIEVVSDHSVKVTALITNYDPESEISLVEDGYYINEMGLFAKEHDGEAEVLYSIAVVAGEYGDFMPPYNGVNPAQIIQEYYATVSNAEEVTIQMGKGAIALIDDLKKIEFPDFNDSGEVEGIESFTDFMKKFVKGMSIFQFFSNLKAGLKYVLHAGQLVNNGMCDTPGLFPMDAAYGKTMTDQIIVLYNNMGDIVLSYESGNFYAQHGEDAASKKVLGEISKYELVNALANSGLGLTQNSTPAQIYAALATKFPPNKSMIVAGWTLTKDVYVTASVVSNTSQVKLTFVKQVEYSLGQLAYYDSPGFDISTFKTLELEGTSYRYTNNETSSEYNPAILLINKNTNAAVELFRHPNNGGYGGSSNQIKKTINVASYTGMYYLRMQIFSYHSEPNHGNGNNASSYINLTKALLSA